ncbi:hypothetical protein ACH4C6_36360 [Streptomyces sp. NPDC017943]|uniref:hypothetical protein n=1 Tax=Streptomyces sp. NPDC017943 TaxID=3365019 RepID=UPI0037BB898E
MPASVEDWQDFLSAYEEEPIFMTVYARNRGFWEQTYTSPLSQGKGKGFLTFKMLSSGEQRDLIAIATLMPKNRRLSIIRADRRYAQIDVAKYIRDAEAKAESVKAMERARAEEQRHAGAVGIPGELSDPWRVKEEQRADMGWGHAQQSVFSAHVNPYRGYPSLDIASRGYLGGTDDVMSLDASSSSQPAVQAGSLPVSPALQAGQLTGQPAPSPRQQESQQPGSSAPYRGPYTGYGSLFKASGGKLIEDGAASDSAEDPASQPQNTLTARAASILPIPEKPADSRTPSPDTDSPTHQPTSNTHTSQLNR